MNRAPTNVDNSMSIEALLGLLQGYGIVVILAPIVILCILITLFIVVAKLTTLNDEVFKTRLLLEEIVEVDRIKTHTEGDVKSALVARDEKILRDSEQRKKKYTSLAIIIGVAGVLAIILGILLLASIVSLAILLIAAGVLAVICASALVLP